MKSIYVYGDSIMKATIPDENMKYRFHAEEFTKRFYALPVNLTNRAKFGAYVDKGLSIVEADLKKGIECDIALVEYGGNDCNFDWQAISQNPDAVHNPKTVLERFLSLMTEIIVKLRDNGITPVMMTLPPVDSDKYFSYITRDGKNGENILRWLGSVDVISKYQEMYSNDVFELAKKLRVFCVDIRSFLSKYNIKELVSPDGIHPSAFGYDLIFGKLYDVLESKLLLS